MACKPQIFDAIMFWAVRGAILEIWKKITIGLFIT
jgi:hypothetical protein